MVGLAGKPTTNLHHCKWNCRCICGTERVRCGSNLKKSVKTSVCVCNGSNNRLRPFESLFNTVLKQAKNRGILCELSYDQYLEFTSKRECHYCSTVLSWSPYNKMKGHKLDRKNNSKGYSKENCVVCCPRCNQAKSNLFTYDEWKQIGNLIRSWKEFNGKPK